MPLVALREHFHPMDIVPPARTSGGNGSGITTWRVSGRDADARGDGAAPLRRLAAHTTIATEAMPIRSALQSRLPPVTSTRWDIVVVETMSALSSTPRLARRLRIKVDGRRRNDIRAGTESCSVPALLAPHRGPCDDPCAVTSIERQIWRRRQWQSPVARGWPYRQLLVAAAGAALAVFVAVYPSFLTENRPSQPLAYSLVIATVGAVYLAVGISAWHERPHNRVGPLMVAVGFGWLLFQLSWLPGTIPWMWQYVTNRLELPFLAWLALVYPTGRLRYRSERIVIVLAWVDWAWGRILDLLMDDPRAYCRTCPHNILLVSNDQGLRDSLSRPGQVGALLLALVVIALILMHWGRATSRSRRSILPLVWMSAPPVAFVVFDQGAQINLWSVAPWVYPWLNLALISVPLGYVYTRVRDRLARAGVGELIVRLGSRGQQRELRQVLARTLRDPTLELAYWMAEEKRFADLDGREVALPHEGDPRRAAAVLERDGEPLAVIIHDIGVGDDPKLMAAATAAVSMAMENERLHALVRSQLDEVRASRARIVGAQDEERRRLERDLHDGAQQRLVTLALALGEARSHVEDASEPSLRAALDGAATEVGAALAELRDLAQGIHPAILTRAGLAAAIRSLCERAPIPVVVAGPDIGRLPPQVEAAGYFLVSEALTNVAKHAQATMATVRLGREGPVLRIEVLDDGVGGADGSRGSGLRGLADRVRACDGRLTPPGHGTHIVAKIPYG